MYEVISKYIIKFSNIIQYSIYFFFSFLFDDINLHFQMYFWKVM